MTLSLCVLLWDTILENIVSYILLVLLYPYFKSSIFSLVEHWLSLKTPQHKVPKIFNVNWFRLDPTSKKFLWPGYCENIRVLDWIARRCEGSAKAVDTPIGRIPEKGKHKFGISSDFLI